MNPNGCDLLVELVPDCYVKCLAGLWTRVMLQC